MAGKEINANVGVNVTPKGMEGAINSVNAKLEQFIANIRKAGAASDAQLKALALQAKRLQTLQGVAGTSMFGGVQSAENLGKRARAFNDFQRSIDASANSMGILKDRVRSANVEIGKMIREGKKPTVEYLNADNLDRSARAYGKVTNEVGALRGRIAQLGSASRSALAPMLNSLEQLDRKNAKVFANPSATNFDGAVASMQRGVAKLREQVGVREKLEAKTRLNIQALREEGNQIVNNTRLEREALAAKMVRQGNTALKNRELIGAEAPYRRLTDLTNRLANQTNYLNLAKKQLNAELAKPVEQQNAARLQQLIQRYQALQREIGETMALRNREASQGANNPTGMKGFFAGIKEGRGNAFGGESGTFGAGALVGRVASYAVAAGAIYGLIASVQQGIRFTIEFEDALAQLQAVSGSTSTEMERLSGEILNVSKNSSNSVMELTKSATIIAQAGYAGEEIGLLLQNVVNLSAASGSTADESVDILTSALGSFQLAATESTRVTDALVSALNDSKLSVNQVQLGLQYVGATARLNNITFNELVSTLGAMADAGIRSGSTMSTGLRQMLVDFLDPSKKLIANLEKVGLTTADIDVKVLGLNEVLRRLRDSGFEAYGALETRASAAYAVLSSNIDNIERLEAATLRQNAASEAAADRLDSLSARWQMLKNELAETGSIIGEALLPLGKLLVSVLTGILTIVNDLLGPIAQVVAFITSLGGSMDTTAVDTEKFRKELEDAGLTAEEAEEVIKDLGDSLNDVETASKDARAEMTSLQEKEQTLRAETEKLVLRKDDLANSTEAVRNEVNNLSSRFPGLREEFAKTEGGIGGLITAMRNLEMQAIRTIATQARVVMQTERLNMQDANETAVDTKAKLTQRLRWISSQGNKLNDPKAAGEATRLLKLVQERKWDRAYDLWNTGSSELRNDYRLRSLFGNVTSFRAQYEGSNANYRTAEQDLERANFLMSEDGQSVISTTYQNQRGVRTASQGNAQEKADAAKQLRSDIATLEALQSKYDGNTAAQGVISSAISSKRATLAQLVPDEEEEKKKGGRSGRSAAQRRERELDRINARIQKEQVEYQQQLYENTLDAFENAPKLEELPETLDQLNDQLDAWIAGETELAVDQIEAMNPTPEQRTRMLETAARKSAELRAEQVNKIADTLAKVLKNFIDSSLETIEDGFNEAMRPTQRNLAIAQGRVQGLSNPIGNQNTPEYLKTVMQNRADQAADINRQAEIGANENRITQLLALAEQVRGDKAEIEARLDDMLNFVEQTSPEEDSNVIVVKGQINETRVALRGIDEELGNIEQETEDLIDANAALKASYDVLNQVPTTFGSGMKTAIEAVKIEIGAADGLGQELIKNLDQPLRAVHQSFKGFFSDIMSGTTSLGQAFENMAKRIIDAILEMVAVALANQFFSLLAGVLFPGAPQAGLLGDVTNTMAANPGIFWRGGQVGSGGSGTIRGYYGGGQVAGGLPTRDSTLINAAQGEYIIRRPAAQSIGKGFLDAINARGAHALKDAGPTMNIMAAQQQAPVNVYVVAPEEKPSMGPNDVLATFSNDVLKGGVTKKLIKQVAAGG